MHRFFPSFRRAILGPLALSLIAVFPLESLAQARPAAARAQAQPASATLVTTVEGISEYSLPNGLRILLVPDQSKPTVTVNITYLVGSRHEGYGESGMAHLLEHLVFKGTSRHPNIPQELTEHGSRPNGTTWYDRTNYFETVPATDVNLDWALDLEADRMVNSFIAKKDLESEFTVVRNEFEGGENSPFNATLQRTMSTAFVWHGYGRSTIGNRADIENVPIERLQAFYRKYYQPDNAILVVAGKFEPDKTLRLIEQKFGVIRRPVRSLENANLLYPTYTAEPVQDGEREAVVRRVGDLQLLLAAYHVPAGSHPDFAAVEVLSSVLGDNPSGRLYKALVDTKLAANAGAFAFQLKEPGLLFNFAQLRTDQGIDTARRVLTSTLDNLRSAEFTAAEVDRAKTDLLRNVELLLNNSERVGFELTEWAAMGDWRLMFLHRDRVEKVTPADVQRVAAAYLKPANRTIGMFQPTPSPDRAEIPPVPDVAALVANYTGRAAVAEGEMFDPSPSNIDARVTRVDLSNGAVVTLLPKDTRGDRVVATMYLRQGTEQSLMNKSTISSLMVAMLSRGTTSLTREQVQDSLSKLKANVSIIGGGNNVITRIETTRPNLLPTLDLVAQQLRSPRFDADEFAKLKQERLASVEAGKSEPQVLASIALQRALYPVATGHLLYAASPDENVAYINAVTLDDVRRFHAEYLGASHADLAVVGDFDADETRAALTRLFGDWNSPQPFSRLVRVYAPTDSAMTSILTPDKAQAIYLSAQTIKLSDAHADYPAMLLANYMLGGGFLNSRLATRLRQRDGLSYGVGSGFSAQSLDEYAIFQGFAIYAPQNADRVVTAFREELDRAVREGFTPAEVDAAKTGYVQSRSQARANDSELMGILVDRRFTGRTMAYDAKLDADLAALTAEQVNAVLRKYLDPGKMIVVRAGDWNKAATP
ncbi:MAG: pitrilysin family protein [Gemmatimonadaceae bacterium]